MTNKRSQFALALLIAVVTARFCHLVWSYAVNLPIWDDFDSALLFANRFDAAVGWQERLALILEQHNEHRIIANKMLTLVSVAIFSSVNFTFLIYCAVFFLLALTARLATHAKDPVFALALSCLFMLQPQYGDGLNWVTTCLASFFLCFMALYCSQLVLERKTPLVFALPLLAIAGFSQGNGILLPFCIAFVLLLNKEWKRAAVLICSGAGIVALYFQAYRFPAQERPIAALFEKIPLVLEYGFTLIGASLGFSDPFWSVVFGVALTVLLVALLYFSVHKNHPALIAFIFFLFLSAAINTSARALSGAQYALSPGRYTILSSGILAAMAIILGECARSTLARSILLASALAFNYFSWDKYRYTVEDLHTRALNDLALYLIFGDRGLTYPWPDQGIPKLEDSLQRGVYNLEKVIDSLHLADRSALPNIPFSREKAQLRFHVNRVQAGKKYIIVEGWGFFRKCPSSDTEIFLRLFNDSSDVVIRPRNKRRGDLGAAFGNPDRDDAGYIAAIPKSMLAADQPYSLEILYRCGQKGARQNTNYRVSRGEVEKILEDAPKRLP